MNPEPFDKSQHGIYEVFSELLERLTELSYYEENIVFPDSDGNEPFCVELENISGKLKSFSIENVSEAINYILNKVEKILAKGENIVSNVSVQVISPIGIEMQAPKEIQTSVRSKLYSQVRSELAYYGSQLTKLMDFIKTSHTQKEYHGQQQIIDSDYIENLPKLSTIPEEKSVLHPKQAALLFHYLKRQKVFIGNDALPISKHLHYLTGHSGQNIRKYLAPLEIEGLKNDGYDKPQKGKNRNLSFLKEHLQEILLDIQNDLEART